MQEMDMQSVTARASRQLSDANVSARVQYKDTWRVHAQPLATTCPNSAQATLMLTDANGLVRSSLLVAYSSDSHWDCELVALVATAIVAPSMRLLDKDTIKRCFKHHSLVEHDSAADPPDHPDSPDCNLSLPARILISSFSVPGGASQIQPQRQSKSQNGQAPAISSLNFSIDCINTVADSLHKMGLTATKVIAVVPDHTSQQRLQNPESWALDTVHELETTAARLSPYLFSLHESVSSIDYSLPAIAPAAEDFSLGSFYSRPSASLSNSSQPYLRLRKSPSSSTVSSDKVINSPTNSRKISVFSTFAYFFPGKLSTPHEIQHEIQQPIFTDSIRPVRSQTASTPINVHPSTLLTFFNSVFSSHSLVTQDYSPVGLFGIRFLIIVIALLFWWIPLIIHFFAIFKDTYTYMYDACTLIIAQIGSLCLAGSFEDCSGSDTFRVLKKRDGTGVMGLTGKDNGDGVAYVVVN